MNRSLIKKSLHESRGLLVACIAALYSFCWLRVWIVSQFEMERFQAVIEQFRDFERFSPVPFAHLFTYAGRVGLTYDEPIVVTCMALWAIARGSDVVSGELGRGTMEMLLSQPVSRQQVLWSQAAVTLFGVTAIAAATWLGVYTGIMTNTIKEPAPPETFSIPLLPFDLPNPLAEEKTLVVPMREKVDSLLFVPAATNLFSLGVFLAGLSSLMSSWDRYRWRTIGIVSGIYIVELIVKIAGLASDRLAWLKNFSFFTCYEPEAFVRIALNEPDQVWAIFSRDESGRIVELGPLGFDLVLIGLGLLAYLLAAAIFRRRDLPAPL